MLNTSQKIFLFCFYLTLSQVQLEDDSFRSQLGKVNINGNVNNCSRSSDNNGNNNDNNSTSFRTHLQSSLRLKGAYVTELCLKSTYLLNIKC